MHMKLPSLHVLRCDVTLLPLGMIGADMSSCHAERVQQRPRLHGPDC